MKREEIEKILEKYDNVACECRIELKTEFSIDLFFEEIDLKLTENYFKGSYYVNELARKCFQSQALFYAAFEDVEIVDEQYEERIKYKKKHITETAFLAIEKYGIELVLSKSHIENNNKDTIPDKKDLMAKKENIDAKDQLVELEAKIRGEAEERD